MMYSWVFRWCEHHRWWEMEYGAPLGWQPAFHAINRSLGQNDLSAVMVLYNPNDFQYAKPAQRGVRS